MSLTDQSPLGASPEQMLYASILNKGMLAGMAILLITFGLYVFGILEPYVPVEELPQYWHLSVDEYLKALDMPAGWGWLSMLGFGDVINFVGVAFLAGVTIICYAAIVPTLMKNKDTIYAVIAILEVIVLTAAATGLVAGGH